jgi:hypothetical protein
MYKKLWKKSLSKKNKNKNKKNELFVAIFRGAFGERGSERGGSAGCRFGSVEVRQLAGSVGERSRARFGRSGVGGEQASGMLPFGAWFGVRTGEGGTVRQRWVQKKLRGTKKTKTDIVTSFLTRFS